ncbi:peptide/nickel transport system permease protein [Catenibacillus scindens]|uniref:Peptide/nickel transport system permease protein n=1 Tax=Catenibacillus scindens TaxID=673271 RepID=A0A7W8H702_9FIRM|nr:ABC transporter permease [Catenibacillus scindens]MBB5263054.1 peptide/nickel transport system permease protein [Catenibacillus scindens]
MDDKIKKNTQEEFSLNDDRRVKVLSPGAMVAKRFFRNRLAVVGLTMLIIMFLFSFLGGVISPYEQDQQFYTYEVMNQDYAGVVENDDFRYSIADGQEFGTILQAQFLLAANSQAESFEYKDVTYDLALEGPDFYTISSNGTILAIAAKDIVTSDSGEDFSFNVKLEGLRAYTNGETSFSADGVDYTLDEDGNIMEGSNVLGSISRFVVSPIENGVTISRTFKEQIAEAIDQDLSEVDITDENGETQHFELTYAPENKTWTIIREEETYVYDRYASPSAQHWLGTDGNGMDMLTRLMYGGRISLVIGFIVVIISGVLGIIMGGIAGYFGKWVDNLIMRIVDVFYCIPQLPMIIILGAAMDAMRVDPMLRMLYLMLILGFLSWPSIARLVRGQILSLREQEFMTATEACGIRASRRIFRHLIPNVIPQLIVICTMSLGSTILTEATLSFLGLGVKFPFASWGNIINDVNNSYVLTNYLFIWIPAGICLLVTVLGFNFVGDGLRDAFDPKMKR